MTMEEDFLDYDCHQGSHVLYQDLANDHIMFLAPNHENIIKTRDVWDLLLKASRLRISVHKYVIISCSKQYVLGLGWLGEIIYRHMICCHFGYSIRMEVSRVKLIDWVSKKLEDIYVYVSESSL